MKMKLIRVRSTGREYAIPHTRYSELPCFRIMDGMPAQTGFGYHELRYMLDRGIAELVGEVELTFNLVRNEA